MTTEYYVSKDGKLPRRAAVQAGIEVPKTFERIEPVGLRVVLAITGDFDEPVHPFFGTRSVSLRPIPLDYDRTQFLLEPAGGESFTRGTYVLKAIVYDKETVVAESNSNRIVIAGGGQR